MRWTPGFVLLKMGGAACYTWPGFISSGPNDIKKICPKFSNVRNKQECLSLASLSIPSIMLESKAGVYPIESPFRYSTLG